MREITLSKAVCSWQAQIWMSGPVDVAKQALRAFCVGGGLCVSITETDYLYAGGEERGFVVGFVNYPRFPEPVRALEEKVRSVARVLLEATHQHSALMVFPDTAVWITTRPQ